jgi:signal peptidase II
MAGKKSGGSLMPWLGIALIVVLLDQFTKVLITGHFALGQERVVTSYFNVVRAHNTGAAFSFLAHSGGWQRWLFTGLALAAAAAIIWMLKKHGHQRLFAWALALVLGGAVGNAIDRLAYGYVVDFLQFHWAFLKPIFAGGYFPAFNVADSAITVGAILLILDEILRVRRT